MTRQLKRFGHDIDLQNNFILNAILKNFKLENGVSLVVDDEVNPVKLLLVKDEIVIGELLSSEGGSTLVSYTLGNSIDTVFILDNIFDTSSLLVTCRNPLTGIQLFPKVFINSHQIVLIFLNKYPPNSINVLVGA